MILLPLKCKCDNILISCKVNGFGRHRTALTEAGYHSTKDLMCLTDADRVHLNRLAALYAVIAHLEHSQMALAHGLLILKVPRKAKMDWHSLRKTINISQIEEKPET